MGDQQSKRVKEDLEDPVLLLNHAKDTLKDLQFIVDHLKKDILCTVESGQRAVKVAIEREIGVLVYSMTEESVKETFKLKEQISTLERENSFLIENEGTMMDELARLTLKNQQVRDVRGTTGGSICEELTDLQKLLEDNIDLNRIKERLQGFQQLEQQLSYKQMRVSELETELSDKQARFLELETKLSDKQTRVSELEIELSDKQTRVVELETELSEKKKEISTLRTENDGLNLRLNEQNSIILDNDSRFRELMTMNCELMDLGEASRLKENELVSQNAALGAELESLKKIITAQKIELEKNREILNRERKLFALKISDIQEQLNERTLAGENCDSSNRDVLVNKDD